MNSARVYNRRYQEYIYTPGDYIRFGDKPIKSPPLINTSLYELAKAKWLLAVKVQWCAGYGYSKIKYHFGCEGDYPYIVFRMWERGCHQPVGTNDPEGKLIQLLIQRDLTPNFSRPPSFALLPPEAKTVVQEVYRIADVGEQIERMEELQVAELINDIKRKQLKNGSGTEVNETPSDYTGALSIGQERLVG
jgi:hypothetical protein